MPYRFPVVSRSMRPEIFRKLLSMSAIHWLQRLKPPLPVMICSPIWAKIRWTGKQAGEGFEYHLLAIGTLLPILIAGPGRFAIGRYLPLPKVASDEQVVTVLE